MIVILLEKIISLHILVVSVLNLLLYYVTV